MSITFNLYIFAFMIPLLLYSCTAPQTKMGVTPESAASPATLTPVPPSISTTIASPQSVPKQNDLVFVEFFAVT